MNRTSSVQVALAACAVLGFAGAASPIDPGAAAQATARVPSVSSAGSTSAYELIPLDGSIWPSDVAVSRHGRYAAMSLHDWPEHVGVWDRVQKAMLPVAVSSLGEPGNGYSTLADITPDGRYVLFTSSSTNLVPGDTNGTRDVFLRDMRAETTSRVSLSPIGEQLSDGSSAGSVTADGQTVFFSTSSKVLHGDRNDHADVYARNTLTGRVSLVSRNSRGRAANFGSFQARASDDGRWVAFVSYASNLAPGDRRTDRDVFLRNRSTGHTWLASAKPKGIARLQVQGISGISGDGRVVAFDAMRSVPDGLTLRAFVYRQASHEARDLLPSRYRSYSVGHLNSLHGNLVTIVTDETLTRNDSHTTEDVYMLRLGSGKFTLLTHRNAPINSRLSFQQELSRDGHVLVFFSATHFSSEDTDGNIDAYIRDIPRLGL